MSEELATLHVLTKIALGLGCGLPPLILWCVWRRTRSRTLGTLGGPFGALLVAAACVHFIEALLPWIPAVVLALRVAVTLFVVGLGISIAASLHRLSRGCPCHEASSTVVFDTDIPTEEARISKIHERTEELLGNGG